MQRSEWTSPLLIVETKDLIKYYKRKILADEWNQMVKRYYIVRLLLNGTTCAGKCLHQKQYMNAANVRDFFFFKQYKKATKLKNWIIKNDYFPNFVWGKGKKTRIKYPHNFKNRFLSKIKRLGKIVRLELFFGDY